MREHKCKKNTTRNEVWSDPPMLTLVGHTLTGSFEHSERIFFCPYCGKDLRIGTDGGVNHSGEVE